MKRDLESLAGATGGELRGANCGFDAVVSDSRGLEPGALFVALRGERFDGHEFVAAAAARGAAAALVSRHVDCALPQVVVPDVLAGLSRYAQAWRAGFAGPLVAITGSNGKTTAKEMVGSILGRLGPCLVTQGNLNNHIGVPLMLCRLRPGQRHAVIEMGANHQREIAHLAELADPDVGVVLNAGPAHLEGFGGLDGVARGKGELFEALGAADTAVINADDRYADFWRGRARGAGRILSFGLREPADFRASNLAGTLGADGFATAFDLASPLGRRRLRIDLAGEHNVQNALAAAACAAAVGADLDAIEQGLAAMRSVAGRFQTRPGAGGSRLIDDSYNANPGSLGAGLRALATVPGERWLVLGEMAELGADAASLHAGIGALARECGVTRLLAVGELSRHAVDAFGKGAVWFADAQALAAEARAALGPGVTVMIKGSRVNRLERVAALLQQDGATAAAGGH